MKKWFICTLKSKKQIQNTIFHFQETWMLLRHMNLLVQTVISGTAFMSTVGGRQFFNISINARIYIAQLIFKDDKLSLLPLAEHFTSKMILNSRGTP